MVWQATHSTGRLCQSRLMETGARQIGAGCPTGPAMPPGRRFGLGGTGASTHAPDFQPVLPVYRERHGSRGPLKSIFASVRTRQPLGPWRIRNLDDQLTRNLLIDHYRRTKRGGLPIRWTTRWRWWRTRSRRDGWPTNKHYWEVGAQVQTALTKLSPELRGR